MMFPCVSKLLADYGTHGRIQNLLRVFRNLLQIMERMVEYKTYSR